jgi:transcriptional regulator GlxA family with amidase domain
MRSRQGGMELSFPSEWLLRPIRRRWRGQAQTVDGVSDLTGRISVPDFLVDRIRSQLADGPVLLRDLAADLGTSARQLQRILEANGTSFRKLLGRQRLETARELLAASDRPIRAVALECGFASPQTFSRAFSNAYGQTPSAFRATVNRIEDGGGSLRTV